MTWPTLISGFTLGLVGSVHCIGMCGPLSMALPTLHLSNTRKFISGLLYQAGRVITYSILGLIFGMAGQGFYLAGVQQLFSITIGILILLSAILYFVQKHARHINFFPSFYRHIQRLIGTLLKSNTRISGFLLLGMANGLLPCGMVYIALATASSFIRLNQAISFMAMFGLGTLPAMMLVSYSNRFLPPAIRVSFRKAIPYFITIAGIILILRGLNLGIQFVSPKLANGVTKHAVSCH